MREVNLRIVQKIMVRASRSQQVMGSLCRETLQPTEKPSSTAERLFREQRQSLSQQQTVPPFQLTASSMPKKIFATVNVPVSFQTEVSHE